MEYRIREHPILGEIEETKKVRFTYDGKTMEGREGEPVAMALKAAGVQIHRYTRKKHEPRGIFCAIGRCTDCVMVVDGVPAGTSFAMTTKRWLLVLPYILVQVERVRILSSLVTETL